MRYCTACLLPNTAPGFADLDGAAICAKCRVAGEAGVPQDPAHLATKFRAILKDRVSRTAMFDCVVGVSGGKDSLRQALWIRDVAQLRPLLVCLSAPPAHNTDIGAANLANLVELGFDLEIVMPAPETWKILCREAFRRFGNYAVATELALYAAAPRVALERNIPTVCIGENPHFRDEVTIGSDPWVYNSFATQRTLRGGDMSWMPRFHAEQALQLNTYQLPEVEELLIVDVAWFIPDWSNDKNALFSLAHGLSVRERNPSATGDLEGVSALDDAFVDVNQMIKHFKFGFGKVTDYVNERIRSRNLTRDDAITLVEAFDGACSPDTITHYCEYLEIETEEFWRIVYEHTNWSLFAEPQRSGVRPEAMFKVGVGL